MKRLMLILMMMFAMLCPCQAAPSAGDVVDGLLKVGGSYLESRAQKKADKQKAAQEQGESPSLVSQMGNAFLGRLGEGLESETLMHALSLALKQALDVFIDEYKEQYKREVRIYVREICDDGLERFQKNENVSSLIWTIKTCAWSIVLYLTAISLFLVFSNYRLRRQQSKLIAEVHALAELIKNKKD